MACGVSGRLVGVVGSMACRNPNLILAIRVLSLIDVFLLRHFFRTTTFALIPIFAYRFVPAVLAVSLLAQLFRSAAIRGPVQRPA